MIGKRKNIVLTPFKHKAYYCSRYKKNHILKAYMNTFIVLERQNTERRYLKIMSCKLIILLLLIVLLSLIWLSNVIIDWIGM